MISFEAGQRFIVTGASSGIGEAVALLLNSLGASVIAVARDYPRLRAMKEKAFAPDNIYLEKKDLIEEIENLPQFVKTLKEKYGKFQGLAYCAGIVEIKPLSASGYDDFNKIFAINYFAAIFMLKGFLDRRLNVGPGAAAVMLSSAAAALRDRGHTAYSGSKSALSSSCACIAKEIAPAGIRVNCLLPSVIATPMTEAMASFSKGEPGHKYPLGLGEVSDVANLAAFLLSDKAKWITGQNYILDCASF
jgi:NAD(P)-dependent dehydrogenase (short-subunit alcohol dehydrogenase family)